MYVRDVGSGNPASQPIVPYQLAFDYTFLCALDPPMRKPWAETYARIIRPGGELLTVVFPMDDREGKSDESQTQHYRRLL